jgi:ferredoxin
MAFVVTESCIKCKYMDCVEVCPVENFKQLNAELAKQWPVISEMKEAPADAKQWEGVKDKLKLLER